MIDVQELAVFLVVFVAFVLILLEARRRQKHPLLLLSFSALVLSILFTNLEAVWSPVLLNYLEHVFLALSGILFAITAYKNHIHTESLLASLHKKLRSKGGA